MAAAQAPGTGARLSIRMFGPLAVRLDGWPLPPMSTRKDGWLLALLVLRHGRELDRSWVAGALWPESSQTDAAYNLRRSLSHLRRALKDAASHIRTPCPHSLRLDVGAADVDLIAFDAAVAAGDDASLETAVALYRGPLLEGCSEEWVLAERAAREEAYLAALEGLGARALAQGEPEAAAAYLRLAAAVDPLRESAQRRLMEALAEAGGFAGAKQVYRDLRLLLHRELNAEPDPETTALFQRIEERERRREPVAGREPRPGSLPRPLTSLIGREPELREIGAQLRAARLLTLTGEGGVGKTRLAIRAADERIPHHAGGVWFIDVAPLADGSLVPRVIAAQLGIREKAARPPLETLVRELRECSALLVLDNCEHLLDACGHLAEALLRGCPQVRLLATSRQALGVPGEVCWRVPPLAVPEPHVSGSSRALSDYPALQLFLERARLVRPNLRITAADLEQIGKVCWHLDGMPLAIELAAAQLRSLTIGDLAAHLASRTGPALALAAEGPRTAVPRQRTLRGTLDWSWGLLTDEQQALLRTLSVFAGEFTLEAAGGVYGGGSVLGPLTGLVDASLVLLQDGGGRGRYRLLETVRQYAAEQLVRSGERDGAARRHRDFYLQLARGTPASRMGVAPAERLEQLAAEYANLQTGLAWSLERDAEGGLWLALALDEFWVWRDRLAEGCEWVQRLLGCCAGRDAAPRARALFYCGAWTERQGSTAASHGLYLQSLAAARAAGDPAAAAQALFALGLFEYRRSAYREAVAFLEESARLCAETGDPCGRIDSQATLGLAYYRSGDRSRGLRLLEASLAQAREEGAWASTVMALDYLGDLALDRRDFAAARLYHTEKLASAKAAGSQNLTTHALLDLARVAWEQGDLETARRWYQEALAVAQEFGSGSLQTLCLNHLACLSLLEHDLDAAHEPASRSLQLAARAGEMDRVAGALRSLAGVIAARGEAAQAARLLGAADRMQEACGPLHSPLERAALAAAEEAARAALGKERFTAERISGRALSLQEVLDAAMEPPAPVSPGPAPCGR